MYLIYHCHYTYCVVFYMFVDNIFVHTIILKVTNTFFSICGMYADSFHF